MGFRRWGIICGGALCVAASAWQVSAHHPQNTPAPARITKPAKKSVAAPRPTLTTFGTPKRFVVPKLGIDNPIIPVGRTQSGEMAMPDSLTEAGWFNEGAFPGNPGTAVLAAHTGYPDRRTVFQRMEQLNRGDNIVVVDAVGQRADFTINEVVAYKPDTAPLAKIFGNTSARSLRFIICTGVWNAAQQTYAERLVVYAERTK